MSQLTQLIIASGLVIALLAFGFLISSRLDRIIYAQKKFDHFMKQFLDDDDQGGE